MNIPNAVDKKPNGKIVKRTNFGFKGYNENICYTLQMSFNGEHLMIDYYGEDDSYLAEEDVEYIINNLDKFK